MIDIFSEINGSICAISDPFRAQIVSSATAPGMFLFVGDKAAKKCKYIKSFLSKHWINSNRFIYAGIGTTSKELSHNIEINDLQDFNRSEIATVLLSSEEVLKEFNNEVDGIANEFMRASGFSDMHRAFIFIVTYADEILNTILPEITMLIRDKCQQFTVKTYLFVNFPDGSEPNSDLLENSAAFMKELVICQDSNFSYICKKMSQRGKHFLDVIHNGPMFDFAVLLELFRSDGRFSRENEKENGIITAMMMFLMNSSKNMLLPTGRFVTAGYSLVKKPSEILSYALFRALLETLVGVNDNATGAGNYIAEMFDVKAVNTIVERILSDPDRPNTSELLSVLPTYGGNPENVSNTNIRNILEYFGGADEEYFKQRFKEYYRRKIEEDDSLSIENIICDAINSERLTPRAAMDVLKDGGEIWQKLNDLLGVFTREEQTLMEELEAVLNGNCQGIRTGLFSSSSWCEIIEKALQAKYEKCVEIEICRLKKQIIERIQNNTHSLLLSLNNKLFSIRTIIEHLNNEINFQIAEAEYTIADPVAFSKYYSQMIGKAVVEYKQDNRTDSVLDDGMFYKEIMSLGHIVTANNNDTVVLDGGDSFLRLMKNGFDRIAHTKTVMNILSMSFDDELYSRYEGENSRDWVNTQLLKKIMDESCANLRYHAVVDESSLYSIGNSDIEFVEFATRRQGLPYPITHIPDAQTEYYEQLMVYGQVDISTVEYMKICNRVFDSMSDDERGKIYFERQSK